MVDVGAARGSYTVQPLENATAGVQALRITDGSTTLWLEYRQALGVDGYGSMPVGNYGVLLYDQVPDVGWDPSSWT